MPLPRTILTIAAASAALAGCGDAGPSDVSNHATISATVQTHPEIEYVYGEETGADSRHVVVEVRPHCNDGSRELDCDGSYRLDAQYRYRVGKPESLRCETRQAGIGYSKTGLVSVSMNGPGTDPPPVMCNDASPGEMTLESSVPMADLDKIGPEDDPDSPPTAFSVSMRITVDRAGAVRYDWRSRDDAHCSGRLDTTKPYQRIECRWS